MTDLEKLVDARLPKNPLMPWREQIRASMVALMRELAAAQLLIVNEAIRERDEWRMRFEALRDAIREGR